MPRDDMGETVFFGYDQAALDREYNNSGKVANVADYLAWYPGESARARETLPARLDLRYGPRPGETLDVFLPEGHGPWPVHVFVHGGYWRSLDKQDFSFVARGLPARRRARRGRSTTPSSPPSTWTSWSGRCARRWPGSTGTSPPSAAIPPASPSRGTRPAVTWSRC